ncbi:hypothetical protein DUI87_18072 [Hirundo rustica rustica]|uniref:Uncharacterized protein n=1 Tax=Hirundo rustica rustica TaxID=333673 RepID=A0A3M0KCL2_HIRRU|nr:hypothetical protein DUI87_18072 [Hirundo rustica rustica]
MALAVRLLLLLFLAVALPARAAQAAPWQARRAAKPVGEGDLASQPTSKTEPLGDDWERDLDYLEALVEDGLKILEDAEGKFSVCLSCQKNQCHCGKSLPTSHFPKHNLKVLPRGKNKATGHKTPHKAYKIMQQMLKEILQGGQVMDQKTTQDETSPGETKVPFAAPDAGAKPVGEGDLASQPTSKTEPLGDVMDQKTTQDETSPGKTKVPFAAPDARAKPVGEGDLASQPTSKTEPLGDGEAKPVGEGDQASQPKSKTEPLGDGEAKPVGEGDLASQPTSKTEPLGDGEDWARDMDYLEDLVEDGLKLLKDAEGKFSVCLS